MFWLILCMKHRIWSQRYLGSYELLEIKPRSLAWEAWSLLPEQYIASLCSTLCLSIRNTFYALKIMKLIGINWNCRMGKYFGNWKYHTFCNIELIDGHLSCLDIFLFIRGKWCHLLHLSLEQCGLIIPISCIYFDANQT